ncbi:MAG: PD-(D/E)XK nuclease family protein [candidate division Zixibacteria bacterium]|nr:PD-(D/E)XK nuclease family protein [candidate division Zixibacteria bacterium]
MLKSYSYTLLNTFLKCPQQFKFKYIDKIHVTKAESADLRLGNIIHNVLKQLYQRGSEDVPTSLEETLDLYESYWNRVEHDKIAVGSDYLGIDDYIHNGRKMLKTFHNHYYPFNQGTLLDVERLLRFTLPGTNFNFSVRIDRLWKKDDGTVEICDYKSGRHMARPTDPDFYYQMGLYQLAVQDSFPQLANIELAQYFLRMDEVVSDKLIPARLDQLIEDIRVTVIETIQAERLNDFPTRESSLCNFCDYAHLCPAKRHRFILEQEEKQDDLNESPKQQAYDKATELLDKHEQMKLLKAEIDALKHDLGYVANDLGVNRIEGLGGYVSVKHTQEEKFVTKTEDPQKFAELSFQARQLKLDEYFKLDGRALMKDIYSKKRLDEESQGKLQPFVIEKESLRVTPRLDKKRTTEDDNT